MFSLVSCLLVSFFLFRSFWVSNALMPLEGPGHSMSVLDYVEALKDESPLWVNISELDLRAIANKVPHRELGLCQSLQRKKISFVFISRILRMWLLY